jgi:ribosome-interacting GTPase 1
MGTLRCSYQEVLELLKSYGYRSAVVKVIGDADLDEIEEQVILQPVYKRAIAVLNRADTVDPEVLAELKRGIADSLRIPVVAASSQDAKSLEELKEVTFRSLEMIRVYTQKDGVVSRKPILMPRGSTVIELAELIHKELARGFRYARVWGRSVRVQGQRVGPDHRLEDGDVVEIRSD